MEENKTKNTMSQSNLGLGYTKISLNVHNIMDDVFDDMKKIINSLTQKDLGETDSKYAKRITSGFLDSNPPDYRWMIPLTHGETEHDVDDQNDIDEYYGLRKQSFMQGMKHLRLRLMLCVANMLDLGDELPFVHSAHPDNVTPPTSIQDARHLNLTVPTCLMTFGRFSRNPLAATRSPPLVFPRTRGPRHATDRVLNKTFVVRTPGPVHDHGTNPALAPKSTALAITSVAATRRAVAVACVQVFAFDFSRRRLGSAPSRETVVHEARACRQRGDDT